MLHRSLHLALSLAFAATLVGCGNPGNLPLPLGMQSGGKFRAKQLSSDKARFSLHHLVVRMKPGSRPALAEVTVKPGFGDRQIHALPPALPIEQAVAAYQADANVLSVERLELFPLEQDAPPAAPIQAPAPSLAVNDTRYFQQWSHAVANVGEAWTVTRGREDVVVAVLDTGVDYTHPDLAGQVINGPDFAENKDDSRDIDRHGTHVAGIIAAKADNGIGVAGVAPGVKVLSLKIFEPYIEKGEFKGTYYNAFSLARAVQYAATQGGAKVINISAGIGDDPVVQTMLDFARGRGLVICVSAGNTGSNTYTGEPKYGDGVFAVHATDPGDRLAVFSSYGNPMGVSAPGVNILSTVPSYAHPYTGAKAHPEGYELLDGTSMAAPFVAGVAALATSALMTNVEAKILRDYGKEVKLKASDIPGTLIEDLIRQTTYDLGRPGRDEIYGTGRVDAGRALTAANQAKWVDRAMNEFLRQRRR